jgi:hypothetical protein
VRHLGEVQTPDAAAAIRRAIAMADLLDIYPEGGLTESPMRPQRESL